MNTSLELWLVRHGATAWALNGRHTGRTDLPLLPEGEEEARRLAPVLAKQRFAAVLVSPLQRAQRTAELAGLGPLAQVCPDLQEWDYGTYEGITTATIRQSVPDWTIWSHGCPGGETMAAVAERCQRVIDLAQAIANADANAAGAADQASHQPTKVALVAHGHILRSLAGTWLGLGVPGGALLTLATATLSVVGYERQQPAILRWNAPIQSSI
ncbi:histidine phosphatase family protein [Cyanobium sp. WAJ14-Wanaka]|uniref:histidine phosphatase family protein n=1 Tax=Cyanobium sp. WAJ14-Wanaka TaxID=2823725 RepID=UPI0020CE5882|nr:histidine phosphatase family protein [Cyanobium sp. WAJ14-Wanaka]MCP9774211.1 histidine phosphatase family protein [Cyanobium sp. WAJ14-Wanaka]